MFGFHNLLNEFHHALFQFESDWICFIWKGISPCFVSVWIRLNLFYLKDEWGDSATYGRLMHLTAPHSYRFYAFINSQSSVLWFSMHLTAPLSLSPPFFFVFLFSWSQTGHNALLLVSQVWYPWPITVQWRRKVKSLCFSCVKYFSL